MQDILLQGQRGPAFGGNKGNKTFKALAKHRLMDLHMSKASRRSQWQQGDRDDRRKRVFPLRVGHYAKDRSWSQAKGIQNYTLGGTPYLPICRCQTVTHNVNGNYCTIKRLWAVSRIALNACGANCNSQNDQDCPANSETATVPRSGKRGVCGLLEHVKA